MLKLGKGLVSKVFKKVVYKDANITKCQTHK